MKRSNHGTDSEQILERLNNRDQDSDLRDDYFSDAEDEQARTRRGTRPSTLPLKD